jgi:hypothetical protein
VKLILLDVRYNKVGTYGEGDLLGETQWLWLEHELTDSTADFHIIGSGIQVLPADKPIQEKWGHYPQSRRRLFDLFGKTKPKGLLLVSGDVHFAEMMVMPAKCSGVGYDILETTSSGLTHSCDGQAPFICQFALNTFLKSRYHVRPLILFFFFFLKAYYYYCYFSCCAGLTGV